MACDAFHEINLKCQSFSTKALVLSCLCNRVASHPSFSETEGFPRTWDFQSLKPGRSRANQDEWVTLLYNLFQSHIISLLCFMSCKALWQKILIWCHKSKQRSMHCADFISTLLISPSSFYHVTSEMTCLLVLVPPGLVESRRESLCRHWRPQGKRIIWIQALSCLTHGDLSSSLCGTWSGDSWLIETTLCVCGWESQEEQAGFWGNVAGTLLSN